MKKYIIALSIVALALLFGCCPDRNAHKDPNAPPPLEWPASHFAKVDFEGHTYIYWSGNHQGGLEHDPACKCHEAKKEEHIYENP